MTKVGAMRAIVGEFGFVSGGTDHAKKFGKSVPVSPIVIMSPDGLDKRKEIWQTGIRNNPRVNLVIDARMGGEVGIIHVLRPTDPDHISWFESTLNKVPAPLPCGAQAIIYATMGVAGIVACLVKKELCREKLPRTIICDFNQMTTMVDWG